MYNEIKKYVLYKLKSVFLKSIDIKNKWQFSQRIKIVAYALNLKKQLEITKQN